LLLGHRDSNIEMVLR